MAWKVTGIAVGSALIVVGIAGLFLPVLQGWLTILAGLAVLSPHSPMARRILTMFKEAIRKRRRRLHGGGPAGRGVPERDRRGGA